MHDAVRLEHPTLVAAQIDHDHGRMIVEQRKITSHDDVAASDDRHVRSNLVELGGELLGNTGRRVSGDDRDRPRQIGQTLDELAQRLLIGACERGLDIGELGCGVVGAGPGDCLVDSFGGRAELLGEILLDALLEVGVALEPELRGQSDDRCSTDLRCSCEVGHGAEADRLGRRQNRLGDPSFGRGQRRSSRSNPLCHLHRHQGTGTDRISFCRISPGASRTG